MFEITPFNAVEVYKPGHKRQFFRNNIPDGKMLLNNEANNNNLPDTTGAGNYFFRPPSKKIGTPAIQRTPGDKPAVLPQFNVIADKPLLFPITDRVFPAGLTFSIGGGGGAAWERNGQVYPAEPFLFSWQAKVQLLDLSQTANEWVAGIIQTVKHWYVNVIWDTGANQTKCTGTFINLHDGFDQSLTWFKNPPVVFNGEGMADRLVIEDSPVLQIPFKNPKAESAPFGFFDFSASFITYVSAFRKNEDAYNPKAYQHLKAVEWSVAVNGSFDGRDPVNKIVRVKSGGTTMGNITDAAGTPAPVLGGPLAIDEIAKILQCWS